MRLDWIFRPRENPCAKFYIIIIVLLLLLLLLLLLIIIIIIITIKQATVTF